MGHDFPFVYWMSLLGSLFLQPAIHIGLRIHNITPNTNEAVILFCICQQALFAGILLSVTLYEMQDLPPNNNGPGNDGSNGDVLDPRD